MEIDLATWIQMAYPDEPCWSSIPDATLIQLVEQNEFEQCCAELALSELNARAHPAGQNLCIALLAGETADKLLRASALGHLLSSDPLFGLDTALDLIEKCEPEILEEIIMALNYEHQGDLSDAVHKHPIVQLVKNRITQNGDLQTEFGQLFLENFADSPQAGCTFFGNHNVALDK